MILKLDGGSLKAMALGSAPVVVQGLRDVHAARHSCASERLVRAFGRLPARATTDGANPDQDRRSIVKVDPNDSNHRTCCRSSR